MKISKHTAGTWHESKSTYDILVISELTGDTIAIVRDCKNDGEQQANAKLIANAPELLKALNDAMIFINDCPHLTEDIFRVEIMTIQEKINKKGYNLVASYNNGVRVGYFASSKDYNIKTKTYKTQTEVLNAIKTKL